MRQQYEGFFPDEHLFFDNLVTMLMSISCYLYTLHVSIQSNNPTEIKDRPLSEWISYIAPVSNPEHKISFISKALDKYYVFFPFDISTHISLKSFPQYLKYEFSDNQIFKLDNRVKSKYRNALVTRMVGSSFVSFYEGVKEEIDTQFGKDDYKNWPDTINYARHVRNGFSHGSQFYMKNPNIPDVNWRNFMINPQNNGQRVLFGDDGLEIGDIVLLMDDVNTIITE